jgi:hypothetical protein
VPLNLGLNGPYGPDNPLAGLSATISQDVLVLLILRSPQPQPTSVEAHGASGPVISHNAGRAGLGHQADEDGLIQRLTAL